LGVALSGTVDKPANDDDEAEAAAGDDPLAALRKALDRAIRKEDYVKAAKLRDEIRHLEQGHDNNDGSAAGDLN
jgi:protein-arginine kinase activator protein McsA